MHGWQTGRLPVPASWRPEAIYPWAFRPSVIDPPDVLTRTRSPGENQFTGLFSWLCENTCVPDWKDPRSLTEARRHGQITGAGAPAFLRDSAAQRENRGFGWKTQDVLAEAQGRGETPVTIAPGFPVAPCPRERSGVEFEEPLMLSPRREAAKRTTSEVFLRAFAALRECLGLSRETPFSHGGTETRADYWSGCSGISPRLRGSARESWFRLENPGCSRRVAGTRRNPA
jgi:hypothetical protein